MLATKTTIASDEIRIAAKWIFLKALMLAQTPDRLVMTMIIKADDDDDVNDDDDHHHFYRLALMMTLAKIQVSEKHMFFHFS